MNLLAHYVRMIERLVAEGKSVVDAKAQVEAKIATVGIKVPGFTARVISTYDDRVDTGGQQQAPPQTCQICGRAIAVSPTGIIAHHGYTRPGAGWQTPSCFGARKPSYQLSRDALGPYINLTQAFKDRQDAERVSLLSDPPNGLKVQVRKAYRGDPRVTTQTLSKPPGFDPGDPPVSPYAKEFQRRIKALQSQSSAAAQEITRCQQRHADWIPPT